MLTRLYLLFIFLVVSTPSIGRDESVLLIRNVTVVHGERNEIERDRDVLVRRDHIAVIQATGKLRAPKTARILNGQDKFLIPGLWDFHVHIFSAPGEEDLALPLYIVNGITGIRDVGALRTRDEQQAIVDAVARGERVGPRIVLAGALIDGPPGSWPGQMVASNAKEGRARVREAKAAGWTSIKSYSLLSEAAYLGVATEAKRLGLPLLGHIPESVLLDTAIKARHRSIEHFGRITQACSTAESDMIAANVEALRGTDPFPKLMSVMSGHNKTTLDHWDARLCAQVAKRLSKAGTAVMPSLMVSDFYLGKDPAPDDPRMLAVPKAVRAQWNQGDWRRQQMSAELLALAPQSVALDWKTFKLVHDAGVTVLAGTDAAYANPFLFHGYSLHDELARYVEAGLTPQQALKSATVNPARFLKQPLAPSLIAAGQRADLVLLDENPLKDISATRRIHAVIASGRLFDRTALDGLLRDVREKAAQ
jgi:imidazolonepropionase-like amidohydrolase